MKKPEEKNKNSNDSYEHKDEFEQSLVEIRRVTRVTGGGKDMNFRACVVLGDRLGKVGMGISKGSDVSIAVNKAVNQAKKKMIQVPISDGTIPHEITNKFKAAKVLLRPARKGRGVIAGGAVRLVLEMAGYSDIISKTQGSNNKMNNVLATLGALSNLKPARKSKIKEAEKNAEALLATTQEVLAEEKDMTVPVKKVAKAPVKTKATDKKIKATK